MTVRKFATYAAGGGLAAAFILTGTGLTDAMTDRWFWLIVALGVALAGTLIVAGPKEGA